MKTFAVIVVQSEKAFAKLGKKAIVSWTAEQIQEARGIDATVCVADDACAGRAAKALPKGTPVVKWPPMVGPNAAAWAMEVLPGITQAGAPAADAAALVVVSPFTPFLPAYKIEEAVTRLRGPGSSCVMTRPCRVHVGGAQSARQVEGLEVSQHFYAFRIGQAAGRAPQTVEVGITEMLDVSIPDHYAIASALVKAGRA